MTKMKFIRFGGLSPVKQTHYDTSSEKPFHNPPRKNGIYAFPYPYIEPFLLGSTSQPWNISNKSQWLKDENENRIKSKDFYNYNNFNKKLNRFEINPKYISLLKKLNIRIKDLGSCIDKNKLNKNNTTEYEIIEEDYYITVLKKPKIFEHNGEIWSHLETHIKPEHIIETSGSWVKTNIENYLYALKKEFHSTKREFLKFTNDINLYKDKNPYKSFYAKDHLEVFIEKLK